MTFKPFLLAILCTVTLQYVHAQTPASSNIAPERNATTTYTPALRIGAGLTPNLYGEAGISLHRYHYQFLKSTSSAFYAALEVMPTYYFDRGFLLMSPKVGYEVSVYGLGGAVEAKYQSDGKNKDFVITPRVGFSLMGLVNLMYGYNISFNEYPFPGVGRNQFSLMFNIYRKPWRSGALVN
jgi:hypothetical protein